MEGNEGVSMGSMGAGIATASVQSVSSISNSSTSIELNSPKGNNGFSSKGLSMFKDVGNFNAEKPMIYISRPSFEDHTVPHLESPKPEVSNNKSIVDINHGKEDKPFFNRPESFNEKPSIIDITKPFDETPRVESFKSEEKVATPKYTELKANIAFHFAPSFNPETKASEAPKPEVLEDAKSQFKNFENTTNPVKELKEDKGVMSDEKTNEPVVSSLENIKPENQIINNASVSVAEKHEEVTHPELLTKDEPALRQEFDPFSKRGQGEKVGLAVSTEEKKITKNSEKTESQPQVEIKKGHASSTTTKTETHQGLDTMVSVAPETRSKIATELREEIEYANAQILPELQRQTEAPVAKVREAIAIEIAKENPVEIELHKDLEEDVRLSKNDKSMEAKAKALFEKRQLEKNGFVKPLQDEMGILYFKKDKATNNFRETMMIMRAEKEIMQKGSVDGRDMASAIQKESLDATSEIVRGFGHDGTLDGVSEEVGMLGRFTDITEVKRAVRGVIEKLTAVKLSKSSSDGVGKSDAEKVYQKDLDGVTANLKEENSGGLLVQAGNGKTIYVSGMRPKGEPLEDELYTSAA